MTTEQREPLYASTAKPWLKYYDQKFIDLPLPECSAFEYVCRQNKNHLPDTALEYYGRKITFADLIVNVKKTAAAFRGIGVKKGDIITVVSVMTPEVIYAFYAADMIGASLNLVDPRYSAEGIHEYIEEVDSRLLICLNVTYERCHKAEKRTNVERVLVISPADSLPLHLAVGYKLTNPCHLKCGLLDRLAEYLKVLAGVILLALFIRLEACFFSLSHCLDNSLTLCLCSVQKAFIALAELVCLFELFFAKAKSTVFLIRKKLFCKLFALGLFFLLVIHCKVLLLMYSY